MNNNVTVGDKAIEGLIQGVSIVTSAIRPTYGPHGINAVVEADRYPYHKVANDAQTIIQAIEITDPVQKRGLGFLKELSDKQNAMSGDGRKTTCIMAETILQEGFKSKLKGMHLKRELDALIPVVEAQIDLHKKNIGIDDIHKVATIAGESEAIGDLIGTIYKKIGEEGVITVEGSGTYTDEVKYVEGVRFHDATMLSPLMAHDKGSDTHGDTGSHKDADGMETIGGKKLTKAVYENPLILVTRQKFEKIHQLDALLQVLYDQGKKDLIIFTDDMDSNVANAALQTHKEEKFNILIIKAPTVFKNEMFEDFAMVTGATVVHDSNGLSLDEFPANLSFMGTCDKIIVDKNETIVLGIADIKEHIAELKSRNTEVDNLRVKWLNTKTAVLKLGANNESELSYRRLKCEDAVNASRLALQDGVVEGGGVTLHKISEKMPETEAGKILQKALKAPIEQLAINAGYGKVGLVIGDENVLDASLVVKNAIRNAVSLASTILTTGIVITLPEKPKETLEDKQFKL